MTNCTYCTYWRSTWTNTVLYTVHCNLLREQILSALNTPHTHTHKENSNCDVMDVLTSVVVVVISQCICVPEHYSIHLKYVQFIFVNFAPIKWKQWNWPIW